MLLRGGTLFAANVGDSRATVAEFAGGDFVARDLSRDQTPLRADERERCMRAGATVKSLGQLEGFRDPALDPWGENEDRSDPPRLWADNGDHEREG